MDAHLAVLKFAESWQKAIVAQLQSSNLTRIELRKTVFNLLAVIVCLYWAERRRLIPSGRLRSLRDSSFASVELTALWHEFCDRFGQRRVLPLPNVPLDQVQDMIDSLYQLDLAYSAESIEILGLLYEQNLAFFDRVFDQGEVDGKGDVSFPRFRKSNGIYYTPKPIVEYITKHTIDYYFNHSQSLSPIDSLPTILDPTCGGGAFLLTAYQYLLDRQLSYYLSNNTERSNSALQLDRNHQWQLSFRERRHVLDSIHGVDIDPQAVTITQISLWLKLIEHLPDSNNSDQESFTSSNFSAIHCGNALTAITGQAVDLLSSELVPFNWQTAFPNRLPVGFDIVMGNPPYLDAERMTADFPAWRSYCTTHYQTATGNWDVFCVFIEKALQLCRVGGLTSLVVPNKLLSAHYASAARRLLCQTSQIVSIRDYSQVSVFAASVYPIVYVAQKTQSDFKQESKLTNLAIADGKKNNTIYEQMQTLDRVAETYTISLHCSQAATQWLMGVRAHTNLIQRLDRLPKLSEVAQVVGAATVAEAYKLSDLIQENATPAETDLRLVNSGTIDRYALLWGQKPLRYLGRTYRYPIVSSIHLHHLSAKRLAQATQVKIIVSGMTRRLECGFDPTGAVLAGKSTSIVLPSQAQSHTIVDFRYLLALLNSRLASFYILNRFGGNRLQGGYLRIGSPQLRQIPIVIPDCQQDELNWCEQVINLVDKKIKLHQFNPQTLDDTLKQRAIDQEVDALVYALYQLEAAEIRIVDDFFDVTLF